MIIQRRCFSFTSQLSVTPSRVTTRMQLAHCFQKTLSNIWTVHTTMQIVLNEVQKARYLSVTITSYLRWNCNVKSKANSRLSLLRQNLQIWQQKIKTTASKSLLRPLLEYASAIWWDNCEIIMLVSPASLYLCYRPPMVIGQLRNRTEDGYCNVTRDYRLMWTYIRTSNSFARPP